MELRHLRYFCAVAEEKNLTRAAEKLFIAQPPLTRQIKQIEEDIGAQLFERHARGLTLTPAGQYFWQHAKQILEKADVAIENTRRIAERQKTLFGIGFVPSVFYGQLPTLVRELRQKNHVEIQLQDLKTGEQIEALKTGKIDIGFGRLLIPDDHIEQTILFQEPMLAVLPADHPLADSETTLEELTKLPMVVYPRNNPINPTFADICTSLFTSRGLKINVAQQVDDLQTSLGLVASGMGFALVSEQVKQIGRKDVVFVPLKDKSITCPVIFSRRKDDSDPVLELTMKILSELVENRLQGRFP
ncbi:LysR family transcriptional regulator [Marinomonas mediterranea]|jgi:Transcriptional regulator|uniref:Transcriptional regulator, LysR family n=1 Tax=Marinomonas mediterranea (strain ATCC 700492 / JCM 21426 / NBRC 103028 / MMB-1) TaxID=717774 RepID=F2JV86_MARM1|nr:LysR family transcriptional regulator [Marinomonas mediterranea]ADZ92844.1 transcriptional regulator, LysR family [Marinomonas mediterranea MMB-1]WCN10777.1 LysR family transcriptional regulator [Marinomonas mediterranea]WCN14834.1 LysR family transcriptional regulator [Marinomonas mediterranea]WCN18866.1 LysR family transcriptional regulator [Marinomonas mediterranea MMB-1]